MNRLFVIAVLAVSGCAGLPQPEVPTERAPPQPEVRTERAPPQPEVRTERAPPQPEVRTDKAPVEIRALNMEKEQVNTLIDYAHSVAALSPEDQRREFAATNQALSRDSSPFARVKLALLLCMPGAAFADDARAVSLLEPLAASTPFAGPLRRFARLLHAQVAERLREHKRSVQLKEQLDALKEMERSLMQRSQGRNR